MATKNETPAPATKRSILATVIEDGYLPKMVSGEIWQMSEDEIKTARENMGKFLTAIKTACKMFDEELKTRRAISGEDHLKGLDYFRKPRDSKGSDNSLLDDLTV